MSDVDNKEVRAPESPDFHKFSIILRNVDLNSGRPLTGAEFKVTGRHGEEPPAICDDSGQAEIEILDAANYEFEQTKAPSGYQLNSTPIVADVTANSFEVIGDQESDWFDYADRVLTVKNAPQPFEIKLYVYDDRLQPLAGAEFSLYRDLAMAEYITKAVSDEKGEIIFSELNLSQYFLVETKAPEGYILPITTSGKVKKYPILYKAAGSNEYKFWVSMTAVDNQKPQEISNGKFYDASTEGQYVLEGQLINRANPESELPSDTIELSLKNINEKGDLLRGAEFKLISPNAEERIINWDNIPLGSFPILRLNMQGEWKLEQTKAPLGYQFIPAPLLIRFAAAKVMVDGDETSNWFDYDSPSKTLTIKNAPIQSLPEGGTKMKVATDNSLKELIKLVKSQPSTSSGGILNVTLDYTIPSYSPVEVETKRKRVYADIPCVDSKVAMNAQITPNDNIENVSLLTYAEPFDGYIRCYFSEQPTEAYIIDSVELTPVTSIVKKNKKS